MGIEFAKALFVVLLTLLCTTVIPLRLLQLTESREAPQEDVESACPSSASLRQQTPQVKTP